VTQEQDKPPPTTCSAPPNELPEAEVREAYATLRSLVASIPHFFVSVDTEYRITDTNRAIIGMTREAMIGQNALDHIAPAERAALKARWDRILATGEPAQYETSAVDADGVVSHYTADAGPLCRGGQIVGIVISTMDITERKRLEETTRQAVERSEAAVAELAEKNRQLTLEMAERAEAERALVAQREALRALSTPILKLWDGVLALPVVGVVDSARAAQMMERLLEEIVQSGARFAILDLTGVDIVDTSTASYLLNLVRAASLLGSRCLISGISPTVAQTMVHLEVGVEAFQTFGTLEDALRFAIGASISDAPHGLRERRHAPGFSNREK